VGVNIRVTTRHIRVDTGHTSCDVCGRTLLRGERAEIYVSGDERLSVCELCTARALEEGWVREGTVPTYTGVDSGSDRRRSLLGRLRRRRERGLSTQTVAGADGGGDSHSAAEAPPRHRPSVREPRHVHAVPSGIEQKIAGAIDLFNRSEHPRTVSGVARSLGPPTVSVRPVQTYPSIVNVVVSWELCWYRYEVDLADEDQSVRVSAQGAELDELPPEELEANATCDDRGLLASRA
jgi:hypothetical protein